MYSQLKEALLTHFASRPIVIAERYRFYRMIHKKVNLCQCVEVKPAGCWWRCGCKHNNKSFQLKDSKRLEYSAVGHIGSKCNIRFKKKYHVDDRDANVSESEGELQGIYTVTDKSKEINETAITKGCPLSVEN